MKFFLKHELERIISFLWTFLKRLLKAVRMVRLMVLRIVGGKKY